MRVILTALLIAALSAFGTVGSVSAKPRIKTKTEHYSVKGNNGTKLMFQMNKRGPKHGWWARSIAQTQYSTSWGATWKWRKGYCRAYKAPVELSITYVYPKLDGKAPAKLRKRWRRFISDVTVHEKYHGKVARQMARAIEKEVLSTRMKTRDRECGGMKRYLSKRVQKVIAAYEKKQKDFDKREHRDGGNVERMVQRLVGG